MKTFKVTYEVMGTITLPIQADSIDQVMAEAENEYPESDINYNHQLVVLDRRPVAIEDEDGSVVEV